MKKILFLLLASACVLTTAKADEFTDFGQEYGMWKGDFAAGDIDGDGDIDIVFSGADDTEKGAIMINDGTGVFTEQQGERVIKMGQAGNIQFGDIDGDGDLDVIFTGWGGGSSVDYRGIALNDGNGIYALADRTQYPVLATNKVTSCGFADFNLDGLLDYYFFGNYTVEKNSETKEEIPGSLKGNGLIYIQNLDGTFTVRDFPTHRFNEPEVSLVDFNKDGAIDIWINAGNEANKCDNGTQTGDSQRFSGLFVNDGLGNFTAWNLTGLSFQKSNGTSSWADVDGDGYMDLLHNGDGYICSGETNDRVNRVYRNVTGIGLEEKFMTEVARVGHFGNGTAWVDWNGDGKLDFISGGWDQTANGGAGKQVTYLYLGNGFSFTKGSLGDDTPGVSEQGYRVADLNGDRKPDLLQCGFGSIGRRVTGWIKNTTSTAVATLDAPTNLAKTVDSTDPTSIALSWKAPASLQGKPGITWNLALKNTTTGKWFYNPMAIVGGEKNGWRKVAGRPGNVFTNTEYYLYDLPAGTYEWTVQAIDGSYFGGLFAENQTFTITASSINSVNGYKPEVCVSDRILKVVGVQGAKQTLNVYSVSGLLLNSAVFTSNINLEMPISGVYIVQLLCEDGGSHRTKVVVK